MNKAPVVYVPTEPEGNGLSLPLLLSLLAHGLVIGILIYTYQPSKLETAGSIETTMVTPGELAEIQGQILANRAAAQAASEAAATESMTLDDSSQNNNPSQSSSQYNTQPQREPVFTRSDEPADRSLSTEPSSSTDQSLIISPDHRQRLLEQNQEYERNMAELAAQIDKEAEERINQVDEKREERVNEERKRLESFRHMQNNPWIRQPSQEDRKNERSIEIEKGRTSDNNNKTLSLSEGESTVSTDSATTSPTTGSSRTAGGSRGASNSEIVNLIKQNYNPPVAAKGSVQQTTLTITVNANGTVIRVTAAGPDENVNEAARQAVINTRKLPIDVDDPKYPTFNLRFRGSN